jgi:hypothetical protein
MEWYTLSSKLIIPLFKCDIPVVLGNYYYENGRVTAQLFWLKILILEGRNVLAALLGHHQVTRNILKGNYGGGRVTVRVILQRDLVVIFVAKISRVIVKHLPINVVL